MWWWRERSLPRSTLSVPYQRIKIGRYEQYIQIQNKCFGILLSQHAKFVIKKWYSLKLNILILLILCAEIYREMGNAWYMLVGNTQGREHFEGINADEAGLRCRSAVARLLRLWARIPREAWMFVWCECCVLSGRGYWDELITRPEESYRLWWVAVCDLETSWKRRPWPNGGRCPKGKQKSRWRIKKYDRFREAECELVSSFFWIGSSGKCVKTVIKLGYIKGGDFIERLMK
jgi:hypothetical protein